MHSAPPRSGPLHGGLLPRFLGLVATCRSAPEWSHLQAPALNAPLPPAPTGPNPTSPDQTGPDQTGPQEENGVPEAFLRLAPFLVGPARRGVVGSSRYARTLRDAVHRAQNMQGCTFHPHIGQKSKEIANTRREKSVYEDLYEESVRRRMQRASKISCPSIHSSQSMIFRFFFYDFLYFYYCLLYSVLVLPAIHLLIVPISHTVLCANYPKYSLIETCIDINTMAAHSFR